MFGIWKRMKTEVLAHKYLPLHDFETSTFAFYDAIEKDLAARELTGLEISRIEYAEGGLLSAKRQYLRMRRERLVFDVCSAAFGTEWFFSWRVAVIPAELHLWEVLVLLFALATIVLFYVNLFGLVLGSICVVASFLSLVLLMHNTVALGMEDIDAALLQVPVVGTFYEIFLRKDTYYRQDTRLAYKDFVTEVIEEKIREATTANGVELVTFRDATPPSHPGILQMIGDLIHMGRVSAPTHE